MSTLQISLAIAGGAVLAAVVAYNTWTSRKNEPRKPEPEPEASEAAPDTSSTGRVEPGLEDGFADTQPGHGAASLGLPALERKPGLDSLIDVIAPLTLEGLVSGDAALAALPHTRRAGSKPFAIEGLNEASQHWETPVPGQRYTAFQAGVQLANRTGALNEIEFSEFVMKTQAFADAVNAAPEFPDMLHEVARGRELDQFASDHDAQLSFSLRARHAAWSPGYVQQNAARQGFVPGAIPGRMVLPASAAGLPPLLGLSYDAQAAMAEDPEQSALREIALHLDVPQVLRAEHPFTRLREVAQALAESMDGAVTDQNGNLIPEQAMDTIGTDLEQLYDALDSRDLAAGSPQARRLFS
ncbi:cell division protein ZipA C-terminal FtsZ-binding domain-containing protein [Curvibacter sp. HBC28]|uniref:Cell division protein ZipA n=1 Tax=Curvibacter microcysteis TaxID=3026419 RepID=A0ABT5MGQ6_9BURK|nr:cell division protein ZipA C-terminal FtsZ-binding domain-containing protein [Curvibacter sp. HBC28]MDD0815179.1 cell division protein ZipA C-terminal FtsZ-binding domain-containing protein [Curvibacter sp. HBC28]